MRNICVLLVAIGPTTASAQSACSGQTQLDATMCAKEKSGDADRELNRLWKQAKPRADAGGTGGALLQEQQAWLQQRDATCKPELQSGGSADPMFYWDCMEEQTRQRNGALRAMR